MPQDGFPHGRGHLLQPHRLQLHFAAHQFAARHHLRRRSATSNFAPTYQGYSTGVFPPSATVGPSSSVNLYSLDLNQRTSYAIQMSASIQHQIGKDGVVEIGYLGTLGLKLQQNVQVSNALPGPSATVNQRRAYVGAVFAPGTVFPPYINVQGTSVGGGDDRHTTQHRAVQLPLAVYARGAALLSRTLLPEFLHFLESHHQRAAVPQRRRRDRFGKFTAAEQL